MSIQPQKPQANDDPDVDNEELADAADDTTGRIEAAPEVEERTDELTAWDEPEDAAGHQVKNQPLEDEVSAPITLVEDGIDEADREQRMAAADPDLDA